MVTLSPAQIAVLLYQETTSLQSQTQAQAIAWLDTAIAVCLAESGGNTVARNPSSSATGLWQIMVSVHGDKIAAAIKYWQTKDKTTPDNQITIYDPRVNTRVAMQLYRESGWQPWEAYNTRSYVKYLGHGTEAYKGIATKDRIQAIQRQLKVAITNGAADPEWLEYADKFDDDKKYGADMSWKGIVERGANAMFGFVKSGVITIGVFILGLVLLVLGIIIIMSQSKGGKSAVKTASNVIPMGKIAKTAKKVVK